jgi:hypothetical protein
LSAVAEQLRKKRNDSLDKYRNLKDQYKSLCEREQSLKQSKPKVTKAAEREAESLLQDDSHAAVLRNHSALKPSQIDCKLITPAMIFNLKRKKLKLHYSLSPTPSPVPATDPTPSDTPSTAVAPIASTKAAQSAKAPKQPQAPKQTQDPKQPQAPKQPQLSKQATGNLKTTGLEDDNEPPRRKDPPELLLNQLNQSEYSLHILSLFLHNHMTSHSPIQFSTVSQGQRRAFSLLHDRRSTQSVGRPKRSTAKEPERWGESTFSLDNCQQLHYMFDSFLVYLFAADDPRSGYCTPRKSNSKASASNQEHPQTNQPAAAVPRPQEATDFSPVDIEMARDIFMSVSLEMEEIGRICYYWSMECYPNLQRIDSVLHHGYEGPIDVAKYLLCNDTGKLHNYPGCQEIIDKICTTITQTREADPTVRAISTDALKNTRYYCRVGICKFLLHNSEPSRAERAIINSEYRIAFTQHSMRNTARNKPFMSLHAFTQLTMHNKLKYMIGYDYNLLNYVFGEYGAKEDLPPQDEYVPPKLLNGMDAVPTLDPFPYFDHYCPLTCAAIPQMTDIHHLIFLVPEEEEPRDLINLADSETDNTSVTHAVYNSGAQQPQAQPLGGTVQMEVPPLGTVEMEVGNYLTDDPPGTTTESGTSRIFEVDSNYRMSLNRSQSQYVKTWPHDDPRRTVELADYNNRKGKHNFWLRNVADFPELTDSGIKFHYPDMGVQYYHELEGGGKTKLTKNRNQCGKLKTYRIRNVGIYPPNYKHKVKLSDRATRDFVAPKRLVIRDSFPYCMNQISKYMNCIGVPARTNDEQVYYFDVICLSKPQLSSPLSILCLGSICPNRICPIHLQAT